MASSSMQMYVIAPSPLVKICLPEWEARLRANPDLINDVTTKFDFFIDSGSRTYRIPFNTPVAVVYADPKFVAKDAVVVNSDLRALRPAPDKAPENVIYVRDPMDLENTYNFLTGTGGGTVARQTNAYGIVPFDPEDTVAKTFDEMSLIDEILSPDPEIAAAAKEKLLQGKIAHVTHLKSVQKKLLQVSEARIKNHLRLTHNNLIRQWQVNEEQNLGKYPPSLSERLGFKVLDPEIKARDAEGAEAAKIANEMMSRKVVG